MKPYGREKKVTGGQPWKRTIIQEKAKEIGGKIYVTFYQEAL